MPDRFICIHGHFYQPPRESPWLEEIARQASAHPFHDWNERITKECYAPNAFSRILDDRGLIRKIVNNYARISFNFGPTLLRWLEAHAGETYEAILEADRKSAERFGGHGSAMAQAFNHMIMPLANHQDKRTQVLWGVEDFQHRFERDPAGMWLPETAVDLETLEIMVEAGIRFTVLAPRQAAAVRPEGGGEWADVRGSRVDPSRAYRVHLPSGREITVFFYDGPLSRAVAFERLLSDGEVLARRLIDTGGDRREPGSLTHIATDGETYGHHHHHGEMALSYALNLMEHDPTVRLTNYGEYLELHPPRWEARIIEGSSWSCVHGVERWRSDCGCSTGEHTEWRQEWRRPLREALDGLRDALATRYDSEARRLFSDPWGARDRYVQVILDREPENVAGFLDREQAEPLDQEARVEALQLLETQRNAMLMYTSCGWFFDDLARIETLQVLRYAARAIHLDQVLFGGGVEEPFLERLSEARSCVPAMGSGEDLYRDRIAPERIGLSRVAGHHAVASLFANGTNGTGSEHRVYCYTVRVEDHQRLVAGGIRFDLGRLEVISRITRTSGRFSYGVLHMGDHHLVGGVRAHDGIGTYRELTQKLVGEFERGATLEILRILDREFHASSYSLHSLLHDEQERVVNRILEGSLADAEQVMGHLYEDRMPLMRFLAGLKIRQPPPFRAAGEFVLNTRLERALREEEPDSEELEQIFHEARLTGLRVDRDTLRHAAAAAVERLLRRLESESHDSDRLREARRLISFVRSLPFTTDLWGAQNIYFRIMEQTLPERMRAAVEEGTEARWWVDEFTAVGEALGVVVSRPEAG